MRVVGRGTNRTVVSFGKNWVVKLPGCRWGEELVPRNMVRGWLANQSEWEQVRRRFSGINAPVFTFFHFAAIYPRALKIGDWEPDDPAKPYQVDLYSLGSGNEEKKGSSWGWFGRYYGTEWMLIDYDRCWEFPYRGLLNRLYWWRQRRNSRVWKKRFRNDV